jgi:hypothetical protein
MQRTLFSISKGFLDDAYSFRPDAVLNKKKPISDRWTNQLEARKIQPLLRTNKLDYSKVVIIANDTKKLNNFTQICASQFVPSLLGRCLNLLTNRISKWKYQYFGCGWLGFPLAKAVLAKGLASTVHWLLPGNFDFKIRFNLFLIALNLTVFLEQSSF